MVLPSDKAILTLHKKHAPSEVAFRTVYEHCQIIDEIIKLLIHQNQLQLNEKLLHVAALLHDIGYYPLLDKSGYEPKGLGIKHGIIGAGILRAEGLNEAVCRIAECHTGVGLTREWILKINLPLPPRDFVPETAEEWLVTYADKLHSKSITPDNPHDISGWFNTPETYLQHARKFGKDNADQFAQLVDTYGTPDLKTLAKKHGQKLR